MSKMDQLSQLFAEWKNEFSILETDFYLDGMINEALMNSCKDGHQILAIAKRPMPALFGNH